MKTVSHFPKMALAAAALASLSVLPAQNDPPTRPQQPDRPADTQGRSGAANEQRDRLLATWLQVENHNGIELAKLAQQRAQNPQVKEFAQAILEGHGEFGQKLQQFAEASAMPGGRPDPARPDPARPDPAGGTVEPGARPIDASSSRMAGEASHQLALVKELGQQCLATARRELESKSGAEFDRCFMGMQIGGHMRTLDMLQVFQRHASEKLRSTLQQGEQTVSSHLQQARQIGKQLEGAGAEGGGKKEGKTEGKNEGKKG